MKWYEKFPHIGYNLDGKKILKPIRNLDELDKFLDKMDNPDHWFVILIFCILIGQLFILSGVVNHWLPYHTENTAGDEWIVVGGTGDTEEEPHHQEEAVQCTAQYSKFTWALIPCESFWFVKYIISKGLL